MRVFLDGKPILGGISAQVKQKQGMRSVLFHPIAGLAYRMETSPLMQSKDRNRQLVCPKSMKPLSEALYGKAAHRNRPGP